MKTKTIYANRILTILCFIAFLTIQRYGVAQCDSVYTTVINNQFDAKRGYLLDCDRASNGDIVAIGYYGDELEGELFIQEITRGGTLKGGPISILSDNKKLPFSLSDENAWIVPNSDSSGYVIAMDVTDSRGSRANSGVVFEVNNRGTILWHQYFFEPAGSTLLIKGMYRMLSGRILLAMGDLNKTEIFEINDITGAVSRLTTFPDFDIRFIVHAPGYLDINTKYVAVGYISNDLSYACLTSNFSPITNRTSSLLIEDRFFDEVQIGDVGYNDEILYIVGSAVQPDEPRTGVLISHASPNRFTSDDWAITISSFDEMGASLPTSLSSIAFLDTVLFIGYSMNDPLVADNIGGLIEITTNKQLKQNYILSKDGVNYPVLDVEVQDSFWIVLGASRVDGDFNTQPVISKLPHVLDGNEYCMSKSESHATEINVGPISLSLGFTRGTILSNPGMISSEAGGGGQSFCFKDCLENPDSCKNIALHLGTEEDFIFVPNTEHTGDVDFTLEAWVKSENTNDSGNAEHRIFTVGTSGGSRLEIADKDGLLWMFNGSVITTNARIRDGKWHHVALVHEGDKSKIYFNGRLIKDVTDVSFQLSNLLIGAPLGFFSETTKWKGGFDEVRFWNYARCPFDIQSGMNCQLYGDEAGLIGYWPLHDGTPKRNNSGVTHIQDLTGNQDGELRNFVLLSDTSNFICNDSVQLTSCMDSCSVLFSYTVDSCYLINFQVENQGFECEESDQVLWSSTDPSFNSNALSPSHRFNFRESLTPVVCIEMSNGHCVATYCDTVRLQQPETPEFNNCPNDTIIYGCSAIIDYEIPEAIDPCTDLPAEVNVFRSDGLDLNDEYPLGVTTISAEAGGVADAVVTCEWTVEVKDTIPPQSMCFDTTIVLDDNGEASLILSESSHLISASDDCSEVRFEPDTLRWNCDNQGVFLSLIYSEDDSGNLDSCLTQFILETPERELSYQGELIGCREYVFSQEGDAFDSIFWEIDGERFDVSSPEFKFDSNGIYTVCVETMDSNGCDYIFCEAFDVDVNCDECNARFITVIDCYSVDGEVNALNFLNQKNYRWSLDGILISEEKSLRFDFPGPGSYELCVEVSDLVCRDQFCREFVLDTVYPAFESCPDVPTRLYTDENCDAVDFDGRLSVGDICHDGSMPEPQIQYTRSDGRNISEVFTLGVTRIEAQIEDIYGARTICEYEVHVLDTILPTCDLGRQTVYLNSFGVSTLLAENFVGSYGDNCELEGVFASQEQYFCNDVGMVLVDFVAVDINGNERVCQVEVEVFDTIAPVCDFREITIYLDASGTQSVSVSDLIGDVTDNCEIEQTTLSREDLSCFDVGELELTLVASDFSGNQSTCFIQVEILDTFPPECNLQDLVGYLDDQGQVEFSTSDINNLSTDNCLNTKLVDWSQGFNCVDLGINRIDLEVRDDYGNSSNCELSINILDTISPFCTVRDTVISATSVEGALVNFMVDATDNCAIDRIEYSMPNGVLYACGEYNIQVSATDVSGNVTLCEFRLEVVDCDACCIDEGAFLEKTKEGFEFSAMLSEKGMCIAEIKVPQLSECQFITQLIWDDGTVTNGMFPSNLEFTHEYLDTGVFKVCITVEESDQGDCFETEMCQWHRITESCDVITSTWDELMEELKVYPNPATDFIFIDSPLDINAYQMVGTSGQVFRSGEWKEKNSISVYQIPEGIYILRLSTKYGWLNKKIVIHE